MATPATRFDPHDAQGYSAPEPTFTPQSHVPHQWYITSEIPETTISAGTCFGPADTGLYLATRVNTFFSTGGDLNMQVTGITNVDLVGDTLINVTGCTRMTTPDTIDVNAAQTITIVSGVGDPAVLFPNHPGNEGGDPGLGGKDGVDGHNAKVKSGGDNTEKGKEQNWGAAAHSADSPVSAPQLATRLGARLAAGTVGFYHVLAAHSLVGKFAGAGIFAGAAVGAGVGIAAFAKASALVPAIEEAQAESDKLPPGSAHAGERPQKGAPDIDMTAYGNIVGKAKTGIGWYTPKAIRSTAEVAIQNHSPVIQNSADKIIINTGGEFIWNHAGFEMKNEAISIVNSAQVSASSALIVNTMFGGIAASVTGGIAASMTGLIAASVTGVALAELSSFGITDVEAGILMNLRAGSLMTITTPLLFKVTPTKNEIGTASTSLWADVKNIAASVKEIATQKMVSSALQTYKGAAILIG